MPRKKKSKPKAERDRQAAELTEPSLLPSRRGRPPAVIPGGMLSLPAFAVAVHRSVMWIRRLLSEGRIQPAGRTVGGVPFFSSDQVSSFTSDMGDPSDIAGSDAATVFRLLRESVDLPSIVEQMKVSPWKIEHLAGDYARLSRGIFVRGDVVDKILDIAGIDEESRPRTGPELHALYLREKAVADRRVTAALARATRAEQQVVALQKQVLQLSSMVPSPERELTKGFRSSGVIPGLVRATRDEATQEGDASEPAPSSGPSSEPLTVVGRP